MNNEDFIDNRPLDFFILREALQNEIIAGFALPSSIIGSHLHESPEVLKAAEQAFKQDVLEPLLKRIKE